jgi:hypothetical protein
MLQVYGGRFPVAEDKLVPYKSLYAPYKEKVEEYARQGNQLLVPDNASPRIIPVFIRSLNPLKVTASGDFRGLDSAFATGFDVLEAQPETYDAILASEAEDSPRSIGTNMAVLDSSQFHEAKW